MIDSNKKLSSLKALNAIIKSCFNIKSQHVASLTTVIALSSLSALYLYNGVNAANAQNIMKSNDEVSVDDSIKKENLKNEVFTIEENEVPHFETSILDVIKLDDSSFIINLNKDVESNVVSSFYLKDTHKLVIDLNNIGSFLNEKTFDKNEKLVKLNVITTKTKTRLVFSLDKEYTYNVVNKGKFVKINLKPVINTQVKIKKEINVKNNINAALVKVEKIEPISKNNTMDTVTTVTGVNSVNTINAINDKNSVVTSNTNITSVTNNNTNTNNITVNNTEINKLSFVKVQGRIGRLTLDLSNSKFIFETKKVGTALHITLKDVNVVKSLQRRLDTNQYDSPVQNIEILKQNNDTKIILEQKEGWDFSSLQSDNKLMIDIRPFKEMDTEEKPQFKGKALTLDFQDVPVRTILQVIANFTSLNIISSDKIAGNMTIRLKDVPWDQALNLIMDAQNLEKIAQGNVVWIATRQEINEKNKLQLELNNQKEELEPLKLEFVQINHYKASELKDILEGKSVTASTTATTTVGKSNGMLSKRGTIGLDIRNNILFIQDTDLKIGELKRIIKRLDTPARQVLIEAKLVIADDKFSRELGAKFGLSAAKSTGRSIIGVGGGLSGSQGIVNGYLPAGATPVSSDIPLGFNLPASSGAGAIGLSILNLATGNALALELSAMEKNNDGKVISSPRLMTVDNKPALIEQGTEIPYVTPGTSGSPPTVAFKKAVLSLGVTPQISPNGRVVMDLDIHKDSVGELVAVQGGGTVPSIDTKNIKTQVTVKDNQTIIMGGVFETLTSSNITKVPFLSSIPFVGNFFKNTLKNDQKAELLIFITPHVINDEQLDLGDDVPVLEISKEQK